MLMILKINLLRVTYFYFLRSLSMSSGLSLSMASVNVGQGVEDMRQRVSKIFQQKTSSPSMSSIFRKK